MEMSWRGGCQYFDSDTRKQLTRGSTSRTPITRTNGGGYRGSSFISNDLDVDYEGDYGKASEAEEPNSEFQKFQKMIADARSPLWDPTDESCQSFSKLSASLFALKLKSVQYACSLF